MNHEHGIHDCYCPNCGTITQVGVNQKCSSQICPRCSTRMRAVETGEYRGTKTLRISQFTATDVKIAIVTGLAIGLATFIIRAYVRKATT